MGISRCFAKIDLGTPNLIFPANELPPEEGDLLDWQEKGYKLKLLLVFLSNGPPGLSVE